MPLKSIEFPRQDGQRYYAAHYQFFANLAEEAGVGVRMIDDNREGRGFEIRFRNYRALIDYSDFEVLLKDMTDFDIVFKYHYSITKHVGIPKLYPFGPISFHSWSTHERMKSKITYTAEGKLILNNQCAGAGAKERRLKVQYILGRQYGDDLDKVITDQLNFWLKINKALVSVCVPGARNDILDRGQWQYMAFGACTISPRLSTTLPFWQELVPGRHFVECAGDYSDLVEKVEWCRENRRECVDIGHKAKALFTATALPAQVWKWINDCVEKEELNL